MAVSRTSGSGLTTALVVMVIVAVGAIGAFVWAFMALDEQTLKSAALERRISDLANSSEENGDAVARLKQNGGGKSAIGSMLQEQRDLMRILVADENAVAASIASEFGIADGSDLKTMVAGLRSAANKAEAETKALQSQFQSFKTEIDGQRKKLETSEAEKVTAIEQVRASVAPTIAEAARLEQEVEELKARFTENIERLSSQANQREGDLQREIDGLNEQVAVLATRARELQSAVDAYRVKPADASQLVDGRVVTIDGTKDEVYISLGKNQRVRPTMTFEVYDDAIQIQTDPKTQTERQGKASIEVIRVGDDTSLARIVRRDAGRAISKGDVIANAVFSADHKYRFLVHGKFDTDKDGRPNQAEADFIRGRILDWGGVMVADVDGPTKLTGDLDFLVVGVQPPQPTPLPLNASDSQYFAYQQAREARELYDSLVTQAREAQIPVLNWNRFQVLTGDPKR